MPVFDQATQTSKKVEIDFLITKKDVITVHYENLEPLDIFHRKLVNDPVYQREVLGHDSSRILYYILENLINFARRQMYHISRDVDFISDEIFKGREEEMLKKISLVKRNILDYQVIIQPQENILNSLLEESKKFWTDLNLVYLIDLVGDYFKNNQELNNYNRVVESLEATNAQILNAKINTTMQKFTVLAVLTFPIVAVASILNIQKISSYINGQMAWLALLGAVLVTMVLLIYFKKKNWL